MHEEEIDWAEDDELINDTLAHGHPEARQGFWAPLSTFCPQCGHIWHGAACRAAKDLIVCLCGHQVPRPGG